MAIGRIFPGVKLYYTLCASIRVLCSNRVRLHIGPPRLPLSDSTESQISTSPTAVDGAELVVQLVAPIFISRTGARVKRGKPKLAQGGVIVIAIAIRPCSISDVGKYGSSASHAWMVVC